MIAAESLAGDMSKNRTVADVLRMRAVKHYAEGLRQYLAIRLGSAEEATPLLIELQHDLRSSRSGALTEKPGIRARLYCKARELARMQPRFSTDESQLQWQSPSPMAPTSYVSALHKVRTELDADTRELLELRHARELEPEEVAHVLQRPAREVAHQLIAAEALARGLIGDVSHSRLGGLRGALQEAFALVRDRRASSSLTQQATTALPEGSMIGERYRLCERVGAGSFGDVYRAEDTDVPGHVVALKLLHQPATTDQDRKRVLRELRLIASVFHPSVVDFKDHGWEDSRLWFVMPWYEGETLDQRLQRGALSRQEAQDIFIPLARALATMHAAGIRHQDVKPENVMLARIDEPGSNSGSKILPVLIDLGVAAKEAEIIVAGTPLYFAPEVAARYASTVDAPDITTKADSFALALTLRNALEPGTQEQVPGSAVEAFIAHRAEASPEPPTGRSLQFLKPSFGRWLSLDPAERPDAASLASEFRILTRPEVRQARRRSMLRWSVPLGLSVLIALGSMGYRYYEQRQQTEIAVLEARDAREGRDEARSKNARLQRSYASTLENQEALVYELDRETRKLERLRLRLRQMSRERQSIQQERETLGLSLNAAEEALDISRKDEKKQRRQVDTLSLRIHTAEKRLGTLENELESTRDERSTIQRDLSHALTRASTLLVELDSSRSQTLQARQRASALERELYRTQKERSEAQRLLGAQRKKVRTLERAATKKRDQGLPAGNISKGKGKGKDKGKASRPPPANPN